MKLIGAIRLSSKHQRLREDNFGARANDLVDGCTRYTVDGKTGLDDTRPWGSIYRESSLLIGLPADDILTETGEKANDIKSRAWLGMRCASDGHQTIMARL